MQKTAIAAGLALVLAGLAVPAMAYHIDGGSSAATVPCGAAASSLEWCMGSGVLIICEQDDILGLTTIGIPGQGGLCSMSQGHGSSTCTSLDLPGYGRSDGFGYASQIGSEQPNTIAGACPLAPPPGQYDAYCMVALATAPATTCLSDVEWIAQSGIGQCGGTVTLPIPAGSRLLIEELFAYWTDAGHVAGFPAPGGATEGTYDVDPIEVAVGDPLPAGATQCGGAPAVPMYII